MNSSWHRWILKVITIPVLLLVVPGLILWEHFGSLEAARAFVRGDQVVILPSAVELGACDEGDIQETEIQVVNLTGAPFTLTGIHTSCSCVVASSLPAKLEAHAIFPLQLTIHSPEQAGPFRRDATLYTDSEISPRIPIEIVGQTRPPVELPGTLAVHDQALRNHDATPYREPELAVEGSTIGGTPTSGEQK